MPMATHHATPQKDRWVLLRLDRNRLEGPKEVEEKIKERESGKAFIDKNADDEKLQSGYMRTAQPCIDRVNETISNVQHAEKKIKIGAIVEP